MQQKTSEFRKNFSEGLKYARIRRNLTQAALANELQEGESTIANWELATNGPHRSKLVKLNEFFGVEIDPFSGRWEPAAASAPLVLEDRADQPMGDGEFAALAHRLSIECLKRRHFLAARALMDLLDELGGGGNHPHELTMGASLKSVEGSTGLHLIHPDDMGRAMYSSICARAEQREIVLRIRLRRHGLWLPTLVVAEPVFEAGKLVGYRGINRAAESVIPVAPPANVQACEFRRQF